MSDVDRDQLPESRPLMLQQLCLLRPHIPTGQAHFALITCADLRAGNLTATSFSFMLFFLGGGTYERTQGWWSKKDRNYRKAP